MGLLSTFKTKRIGFVSMAAAAVLSIAHMTGRPAHAVGVSGDTAQPLISAAEWSAFKARFVGRDGRVIDRENRSVSHSEGQGYGMLLAVHAGDRATFGKVWDFARQRLQIRHDALLAWRYVPHASPNVPDMNNATDGDIIVAYALLRAATLWNDARYLSQAKRIVDDIGRKLIGWHQGTPYLTPGAFGFERTAGNRGPVVNLSYYFYRAFDLFEVVAPQYSWETLAEAGRELTVQASQGRRGYVPDWIVLAPGGDVRLANGFDARSSYDAVRVPLYAAYDGRNPKGVRGFDAAWNLSGTGVPVNMDLERHMRAERMGDPGYRMIAALAACLSRGTAVDPALLRFRPTTYFASSLHLIALVAVRERGLCTPQVEASARETVMIASSSEPRELTRPVATRTGTRTARRLPHNASLSDRIMASTWLPRR